VVSAAEGVTMAVLDQRPTGSVVAPPVALPRGAEAPGPEPLAGPGALEQGVTVAFVALPTVAFVLAVVRWWGDGLSGRDVAIALVMYIGVGFGVTVGFHRMLTHRSFRPARPLKIALAIAGSMAFEGGPIGWVADHRRHHRFSDRAGDPHSPQRDESRPRSRVGSVAHAHVGWLFRHAPSAPEDYAHDLLGDPDLVTVDRLFPLWCALSLAVPFALGYLSGGGTAPALTALLWAGGVRVFVLHHVTWSINSICHTFGAHPFRTRDRSGNVAALAIISFGESWHNGHHALPRSARHGVRPHQWDPSARLIGAFERLGWATAVIWPTAEQVEGARAAGDHDGRRRRGAAHPL
jgi:stearoyl-CoA desaturase (delta-9 desaturase)